MSFILDALRKAERDRSVGHAPRIEDVALARESVTAGDGHEGVRRSLRMMQLALLILIVALATFLMFRKSRIVPVAAQPPSTAVVTATVRGPAPASVKSATEEPANRAAPDDNGPPAIPADVAIASLDDLAENASPTPAPAASAATLEAPPPNSQDFVAKPALPMPASKPSQPTETLNTGNTTPPEPQPSQPATASLSPSVTATPLVDMPAGYRTNFPAFAIEVHSWDSDPDHRFVLVSGRRYHEGDTMTEGPHIIEIVQDGMVLEFGGTRVLYSLSD